MPDDAHRHRRLRLGAAVLILGAALALSACSDTTPTPSASPSPPAPSASSASAPSDSETSDTDAAVAAATAAARSYYSVTGRLFSDPQASMDEAVTVAGGEELDELRRQLQERRVRGEQQVGAAVLTSVTPTSADLQAPTSVDLDVCVDVSAVDVQDATGQSLVAPDRPLASVVHMTVVDRDARGWLVETTEQSGEPCAS